MLAPGAELSIAWNPTFSALACPLTGHGTGRTVEPTNRDAKPEGREATMTESIESTVDIHLAIWNAPQGADR